MFNCEICSKEFETSHKLRGHIGSHYRKSKKISEPSKNICTRKCHFCEKEFKIRSIGAHLISCKLNPKFETYSKNRSIAAKKRKWSQEHRENLSKTIMNKIDEGTWHLSFSKSRTHEYKGIKFHGLWEVKFAKYLDENNIEWQRPIEKFQYEFEGKKRSYTPDFWIPELNSYLEIKGYTTSKDEEKWQQFPLNLIVFKGEDLVQLEILMDNQIKKSK